MIIFLYGPDSYRSRQKLEEIIAHYKSSGKSGVNLISLDCEKIAFDDFYSSIKISSMFAEKKLIILKNIFENKTFSETFLKELKTIEALQDVVVIYENEAPDARLKLFKTLTKECKAQEFAFMDAKKIKLWVQEEFVKQNTKINLDALDLLLNYVASDMWQLSNEIAKLVNYKKNMVVQKADVELMVRPKLESDIFKTIDALAQKNKAQALSLMQKHIDMGETPLYLLSMIAYQFKNLLVVKELAQKGLMYASIVQKSGLHPFVVKKTYFMCNQFSFDELKSLYKKIFQMDVDIKTGKIEPETALQLFVSHV